MERDNIIFHGLPDGVVNLVEFYIGPNWTMVADAAPATKFTGSGNGIIGLSMTPTQFSKFIGNYTVVSLGGV